MTPAKRSYPAGIAEYPRPPHSCRRGENRSRVRGEPAGQGKAEDSKKTDIMRLLREMMDGSLAEGITPAQRENYRRVTAGRSSATSTDLLAKGCLLDWAAMICHRAQEDRHPDH